MPLDNRRLPVPEESQPVEAFSKEKLSVTELVDGEGKRCDGRRKDEVRPLFLKTGVVSQAKGSAYIEMNHTKLICAVYGPREVLRREEFSMQGQLACEVKFATFSCQLRRGHQQDGEEKDYSLILQEALSAAVQLDKFPKARMDVFVTVLQDDGSCLAAAISCASVALADAGVEMYDLVVGSCVRNKEDLTILDPCKNEEYSAKLVHSENNGGITVGFMPSLNQVSALLQKGEMHIKHVTEGIKSCVDTCQRIYPVLQQCLVKSLKTRLQHKPHR